MKRVIIESPYAGNVVGNMTYLRRCIIDCLFRGESPYASHLMLTTTLDDTDPDQRALGLQAAKAWYTLDVLLVVYTDFGISSGMVKGIQYAEEMGMEMEIRNIGI